MIFIPSFSFGGLRFEKNMTFEKRDLIEKSSNVVWKKYLVENVVEKNY